MALPLPSVIANTEAGGPFVTAMRGVNALTSDNLQNQIRGAEAQYAPYTQYADAASKIAYANLLPYQINAQMLSNPLLWMSLKDHPEAINQLMKNFSGSIPNSQQLLGGIPKPQSRGNSLLGLLLNKLGIGSSPDSGNALSTDQSNSGITDANTNSGYNPLATLPTPNLNAGTGSPLVPATGGTTAGIAGQMGAKYTESPYGEGKLIPDPNHPGDLISTATGTSITNAQNSINAAERVAPQLERLANLAEPFLSAGGMGANQIERGWNYLFPQHAGKLPEQYAQYKATLESAPEALVKTYGLRPTNETIDRMQRVIEPYIGETGAQYKARILGQLEQLRQEQIGVSQKNLAGGFPVSTKKQESTDTKNEEPKGNISFKNDGFKPEKMLDRKYKSKEEFLEAYKTLSPEAQAQVRAEMKKRGMN